MLKCFIKCTYSVFQVLNVTIDVQNAFPYTHIVCFNNEVKIYATESSKEIQQNSFFLKKQKFIWSPFISEDC